jgi:hypothetical protein
MKNKFEFFEVVKVNSEYKRDTRVVGLEGTVLGMAQNEQGLWGYAVFLDKFDEAWDFMENHIDSTGRKDEPSKFYDGTSIKVKVDPKTGEGDLA